MTTVKVFMVGGDAGAEALAAKVAGMPGFRTEIYTCPKAIEDLQPTPFIEVDGSQRFFGKEGIETFLAQQASAKK